MYDAALSELAAKILSYAAVLHLAVGCWAYSARSCRRRAFNAPAATAPRVSSKSHGIMRAALPQRPA